MSQSIQREGQGIGDRVHSISLAHEKENQELE